MLPAAIGINTSKFNGYVFYGGKKPGDKDLGRTRPLQGPSSSL